MGVKVVRRVQGRAPAPPEPVLEPRLAPSSGPRPGRPERERQALLVAGETIIGARGFARTTVDEIAERAGVSVDTFRAHFQSKSLLLRALNERFVEKMLATADQTTRPGIWTGARARDVVEVAVRSIVDVVIEHEGLVRAFLAQGEADPTLAEGLRRIGAHLSRRIIAVLGECRELPARPSRAVAFSLLLSVALAHHYVLVGDEWSGVAFSREQLAEETAHAITAYLGLPPRDDAQVVPEAPPTTQSVRAVPKGRKSSRSLRG
jgi:AcrR family transcriptional regulator